MAPDRSEPPSRPRGAVRVGTVSGVDVYVRGSWFVVALLIAVLLAPAIEDAEPGLGGWKYVAGLAFAVLLYLSILLHEMSHAVMARRYGLPVRSINLEFLGGFTEIAMRSVIARMSKSGCSGSMRFSASRSGATSIAGASFVRSASVTADSGYCL